MCALRSSSRSRTFSRSSFRTFFSSRFPPEGFGPRFLASSRSDPSRAAFRHPDRCELYSPSRRSSSPILPGVSQASAFSMTDSLYAAVKRRLVAFAVTSGSGRAAALRLPSPEDEGVPFDFIPSPGLILHLSVSPYSKHFLHSCLALVGREGTDIGKVTRKLYRGVGGAADVATEIADIVETAREWGRLGDHPSTGAPVFVKVGPNGRMYVQLGRRSETTPRRALRIELPDRVEYESSDPRVVARYTSRQGGDPNDVTLDQALKLIDEKLERERPWGADPKSRRPIFLRMGHYGHYLQLGRTIPAGGSGSTVRVSVPPHIDPDALTLKEASRLLHRRMEQDRPLGQDPVSGQNVYVKDGRFGPFARLGERKRNGPRVKIVGLPEGLEPDDVDLERALALLGQFALRNLGPHPDTGAAVTVQTTGRFGPFVSCRREHATVPERFDPMDVTLEEAVRFLAAKRELMVWRREARAEFDKAVSPPGGWYERLGQVSEMDLEPAEIGRLLQEKRAEYYAGLTEPERTAMLDRIEAVRVRQQHPPHEAHRRGDISDEALERAIQYLDEWFEEARRAVARDPFSERVE